MEKRILGLDIIRSLALVLVVAIHGITMSDLVGNTFGTVFWIPTLLLRTTALACVPLFIILTGYLNKDKVLNKEYFSSVIGVLVPFYIIAVMCEILKMAAGETTSIFKALLHIFDFSANGYAWYIEMYIGLFIMIPFLNMFYKMLGSPKNRITATAVIVGITMLPAAFSSLGLSTFRLSIFPDYWEAMYPVGYYFLGMVMADIKPEVKKWINSIILIFWICLMTAVCFVLSHFSGQYAWWFANGFGCIYNAITAALIFILFYNIDFKDGKLARIISIISLCSLEAYLFSYITDKVLYNFLDLPMPVMTFLSLALSLICAYVLRKFTKPVIRFLKEKYINIVAKKVKGP
ncbi:MAG: hypothetical protein E7235_04600 [Lachnospiraceae bacterium]|nr:hypothetical protein [Lachnospiraceae bacterium]